ncbi:EPT/RTPC-like protein [Amniculicola lignicola CBS 123094]|uniref:EPT/RTPC-like protein n=1 Tax=Amniculicola lignicola CBS 123094 TaxID=1392246 RepID=A0A6A5WQH1_9PLEO|nr:EPT/RTPC-like protein [Amniculicola lignicola CBS 123094]
MPRTHPSNVIHLPGTTLEGGGQLLRLAICLSSLTSTPIRISDIRGKRSGGGGLKAQHLTSVVWLARACGARVSGVGLGSREIVFGGKGGKEGFAGVGGDDWRYSGEVRIQQSTPGSVNLVFQAILPYILFSSAHADTGAEAGAKELQEMDPIRVRITGGTNVSNSPSYDYIHQVLLPMLEKLGIPRIDAELHSRGWSTGSTRLGTVTYTVRPLPPGAGLKAFELLHRGAIVKVQATILAPREYERMFQDLLQDWVERHGAKVFGEQEADFEVSFEDSHHAKRFYLLLVATTSTGLKLGRDWLYDRAVRPGAKTENVVPAMVKKVFGDLVEEVKHGGCVDEFMRDQVVVFQALAEGRSRVFGGRKGRNGEEAGGVLLEPSLHAKTAQWVVEEILGVGFDEEGGCEGVGFGVDEGRVAREEKGKGEEVGKGKDEEDVDRLVEAAGGLKLE